MPSKRRTVSAPSAEEIVGGPASVRQRQRHAAPRCSALIKGRRARGLLDPYAGAGYLTVAAYTDHLANLLSRIFVGDR